MNSKYSCTPHWVATTFLAATVLLAGCSFTNDDSDGGGPSEWEWTELGGPGVQVSAFVGNHEPLAVVDSEILLGTGDGVWRRPLSEAGAWQRAGLEGMAIHAVAVTDEGGRIVAAGFDPADESAPTVWYSTDEGETWTPASTWPRGEEDGPLEGISFPFYSLEPDPDDPYVIYGGLSGDTVAITVDGGATWVMANGETEPGFGDTCVAHRPADSLVLLQGCELPLDTAWVGARDVIQDDRFTLADFRFLFGYPDFTQLGNRRINSMAGIRGRDDAVLVGVEGGLVELSSTSGDWSDRDDVTARWILHVDDGGDPFPYAYIRAIATLDDDGDHVLFGGAVNGEQETLSLFETTDGGDLVHQLAAPIVLHDPRIEQALRLDNRDVLLVISDLESATADPEQLHSPKVFRLRR